MNSIESHLDSDTLLRLIDEDLPPKESFAVAGHLAACGECLERLEAVRDVLADYGRFHEEILKPALPSPPPVWKPLPFPVARRRDWRPAVWMLAAAAAIAVVILVVIRAGHPPEVRAAELLHRAMAAEKAAVPSVRSKRHVRIRSGGRVFDWPSRHGDRTAIQTMFDAAGYPSEDPLSATAFSQWRDAVPAKHDEVEVTPTSLIVRTSALAGAISDGELTLRSADLHAVACKLRLRSSGDWIEMAEIQDQPEPPALPPAAATPPSVNPPAAATIADELHVITALHKIGADLGEPVEVERTRGRVQVRVSGLDQARRDEIREALAGVPTADVHFEQATTSDAPAADDLIGFTERAAERAYALRALTRRFPCDAEAQMSEADAASLRAMVRDHAVALGDTIHEIERIIGLPLPDSSGEAADWRSIAENAPNEVDQLDRLLNGAAARSDNQKPQIARILAELDRQARALRSTK